MSKPKKKHLYPHPFWSLRLDKVMIFVAFFALIGVGTLLVTKAATPFTAFEAESSQLSGNIFSNNNDSSASGNGYLKFGETQPASVNSSLQSFATGLSSPVDIVNTGVAGDTRLFVVERSGKIRIVSSTGTLSPTPFLDISSKVITDGERGLLGLAFHPQYSANGQFYVYYIDSAGSITISRFIRSSATTADANSEFKMLQIPHNQFNNHNGGALRFGPKDGYLYIGTGDGGSGGDPLGNGQNTNSLLGKILRIDVDSGSKYGIPPSNPFEGTTNGAREIWAYGVRNPWRISFDRLTGDLIIADVGQGAWEEIDFQPNGTPGGRNYGWNCYEGNHNYSNATSCPPITSTTQPVYEYDHSGGRCSITGGYRYRGTQYPKIIGQYIFDDYCSGDLGKIYPYSNSVWQLKVNNKLSGQIVGFGEDINGELYAASIGDGVIYKVVSP